ncbi:MAG: class I SAM-dependent methyltransferase [Chloroflexota bacterium]|nr:MAG: class I SAM-dependent methyltransferase [Chloroflexota bacterium]
MAQPARSKRQILRDYLLDHIEDDSHRYYGRKSRAWLEYVADAWLNDASNSAHRYQEMYDFAGEETVRNSRILDMASGCGTFVYYGLINGVDVWGIEPEDWKNTFNKMKADVYGYPEGWKQRFIKAVGENLPFPDAFFDFVSSYQTMEHVQDIQRCLTEMLRVARIAVFLKSPDYCGTFEGHYRLPWLPLFPRPLARLYLRFLGRQTLGLDSLQDITERRVKRILKRYPARIHDRNGFLVVKQKIDEKLGLTKYGILGSGLSYLATGAYLLFCKSCRLFRREKNIDLIISKSI